MKSQAPKMIAKQLRTIACASIAIGLAMVASSARSEEGQAWEVVAGGMTTEWGREVTPETAWAEYPRPQLTRDNWDNLNGLWDYAVTARDAAKPAAWEGKILVPYAIESSLSGVGRLLEPDEALWYRRTFAAPRDGDNRTLLHFEAVDYQCKVWVNGKLVGEHQGGSLPFAIDVTDALRDGENELVLKALDETRGWQLRGKQTLSPQGIWYTRVSGIWQTVWLETVPARYIESLKIDVAAEGGLIRVTAAIAGQGGGDEQLRVTARLKDDSAGSKTGKAAEAVELNVADAKLWSPAEPNLYDLTVALLAADGTVIDEVGSYAGIRTVGKEQDENGDWRFTLNGKPIFHWGVLDQGWWPDGLLTPPSDEAMTYDIEFLKAAGFNMIRKHIKVEPRRYYAACDRIGMLVWQDQISGGNEANPPWTRMRANPDDGDWPEDAHQQYMAELKGMIDSLRNHPSIVVWVPFNEAWGQHRTMEVGQWTSDYDPSRLVNVASGGNFWPVGDVADHHEYPAPKFPLEDERFADFIKVVGEFGGHGYRINDHLWNPEMRNWGYGDLPKTYEEYVGRYVSTANDLGELRKKGVAGGLYTQTTDVEGEINGLMTYDRAKQKIEPKQLHEIHRAAGLLE